MPRLLYRGEATWVHRLHPLVKLGWLLVFGIAGFIYEQPLYILGLLLSVLLIAWQAHIHLRRDLRGSTLILWMGLFLFALQAIFYHQGETLLTLRLLPGKPWSFTDLGLRRGITIGGRFVVIVLSSQIFVLVTDPSALAYALMRAGLPYRYGFAFITALRLVPVFEEEATTVYQAQLTRGVRYDAHALRRAYELLRQFLLPMLVSALRKVDALAISMEGRQFGRYPRRTFLRSSAFKQTDRWATGILALFILLTTFLKISF